MNSLQFYVVAECKTTCWRDSQNTPLTIHTGLAIHLLFFLRHTPPCPACPWPIGQNGGGRERPPSFRARCGRGAGRVPGAIARFRTPVVLRSAGPCRHRSFDQILKTPVLRKATTYSFLNRAVRRTRRLSSSTHLSIPKERIFRPILSRHFECVQRLVSPNFSERQVRFQSYIR